MQSIHQTYRIHAPITLVWKALVDPVLIEKWSGAKATMDEKEGTKFRLWDGDIFGTNTKVVPMKELEQDWYGGKWEKPSKVIITLREIKNGTQVELVHTDMPEKEIEDFAEGWKSYYFEPIKELLEK